MEKARKKYRYIFQDMSIRKKIFFGYLAIICTQKQFVKGAMESGIKG